MSKINQALFAELIGTFALVLIGAGAVVVNTLDFGGIGIWGIAASFGLVVMAMVYTIGAISGSHINPAVTLAMFLAKKIDQATAVKYILVQLLGAAAAGFVLRFLFPQSVETVQLGVTKLASNLSFVSGIAIELILTFFLVFVVLQMVEKDNHHAGLAIGATVTFDILFGASLTGASMNPARTFGPALASGYWPGHLIYWIGPLLGAVIAYLVWRQLVKTK